MNVLVEDGQIKKVEGLRDHPLSKGQLCPKGKRPWKWFIILIA